ncbi:MAG: TRAP transporter small permease subunit, partial [Rhodobacteraceae bacterium]|nr:TRAP transporter small permease subunit [Paracoccaceae bacterium]
VGMLSFLGYLTWQSWEATARAFASGQTSLTTKIPIWVVNAGMFAAFALSILRTIQGFLRGAYRIDQPVVE